MESSNNLKKDTEKKGKIPRDSDHEPTRKPEPPKPATISFDAYFRMLLNEGKVQSHHKVPLKAYFHQNSMLEATRKDFDTIFRKY